MGLYRTATFHQALSSLAELQARRALERVGADPAAPLTPIASVNNRVWITDEFVVRVNTTGSLRLGREASIVPKLPPEVPHAEYLGSGISGNEYEWYVARRVAGQPLSRSWPSMSDADRERAMASLARSLRALHNTPAPAGLDRGNALQLVGQGSNRLREAARHARATNRLSPAESAEIDLFLDSFVPSLDAHPTSDNLIHGDLVFENIMWDGKVLSLLDFEFSRAAPPTLELDVVLRYCGYPQLHSPPGVSNGLTPSQFRDVPRLIATYYPELFDGDLVFERLCVYAMGFELRLLLDDTLDEQSQQLCRDRIASIISGRSHLHWIRSL